MIEKFLNNKPSYVQKKKLASRIAQVYELAINKFAINAGDVLTENHLQLYLPSEDISLIKNVMKLSNAKKYTDLYWCKARCQAPLFPLWYSEKYFKGKLEQFEDAVYNAYRTSDITSFSSS